MRSNMPWMPPDRRTVEDNERYSHIVHGLSMRNQQEYLDDGTIPNGHEMGPRTVFVWGKAKYDGETVYDTSASAQVPLYTTVMAHPCNNKDGDKVWDGVDMEPELEITVIFPATGGQVVRINEGDIFAYSFVGDEEDHIGVCAGSSTVLWGKCTSNWVNIIGMTGVHISNYVPVTLCDAYGDEFDTSATDILVYLPRIGNLHPNLIEDDIIAFSYDADGHAVCMSDYNDGQIGDIKIRDSTIEIHEGWQLCDGADDPKGQSTMDLSSKFLVGHNSSDTTDGIGPTSGSGCGGVGNIGGYKRHGGDSSVPDYENTHDDHYHARDQTLNYDNDDITGGVDYIHSSSIKDDYEHSMTDNRPPWTCVAFVVRVDNSADVA